MKEYYYHSDEGQGHVPLHEIIVMWLEAVDYLSDGAWLCVHDEDHVPVAGIGAERVCTRRPLYL